MTPTTTPEAARLAEERERFEAARKTMGMTLADLVRHEDGNYVYNEPRDKFEGWLAAKQDAAPTSERPQVSIPLSENFYIARDQIKREFRRALGLRPDIGHSGQGAVGFGEQCDLVDSMLNQFASSAVAAGGQTTAPKPETAPRDLASLEDLQRWLVAFARGAANMNPEFSVIRRWTNALVSVTGRAVPRGWED